VNKFEGYQDYFQRIVYPLALRTNDRAGQVIYGFMTLRDMGTLESGTGRPSTYATQSTTVSSRVYAWSLPHT